MVRLWMRVLWVPSVWIIQMRSTFCQGPSWQYIRSWGSVGEKSRWLTQSVECSSILMSPGFSPLGPGSSRMVKSTSGGAARRVLHHLRPCWAADSAGPGRRWRRGCRDSGGRRWSTCPGRSARAPLRAGRAQPPPQETHSVALGSPTGICFVVSARAQRLICVDAGQC
jgi:hypothetical protein